MLEPLTLGTTKVNELARCMKLYEYHAILKLIPKARNIGTPMRRGIWVHSGLEGETKGVNWADRMVELTEWALNAGADGDQISKVRNEASMILAGHDYYWSSNPQAKIGKTILAEKELILDVPRLNLKLTATVDLIAEYKGGIALVEHKSTNHIPPANWRAVDPQTAIQYLAARQEGIKVDYILFNYLLTTPPPVPQIIKGGVFSTRKIETTTMAFNLAASNLRAVWKGTDDELTDYLEQERHRLVNDAKFYQRYEVHRPERYLRETAKDLKALVGMLRLAESTGHYPRSFHPFMCTRMCSYSNLCSIEYMSGRPSPLREVEFEIDKGQREGSLSPLSPDDQNIDLDDEF